MSGAPSPASIDVDSGVIVRPLDSDVAAIARIDVVQKILEVVCRTTGMGFSAVAKVTEDRWIACAVRDEIAFGLEPGGELPLETTICNEIRQCGQLVVIDEVAHDDDFRNHPTPKMYGFQSYISVPINLPGGAFFGTLCAIDPRPARLKDTANVQMFELFASLIAVHLDAQRRLEITESALYDERRCSELRDQFIAVLGHDLRAPLAAIQMSAHVFQSLELPPVAAELPQMVDRTVSRMSALIDKVLDFARSRLGGGFSVNLQPEPALESIVEHVISETQTAYPGRRIDADLRISGAVVCDGMRIGQALSNLLANAVAHGDAKGPIRVDATNGGGTLEISVANTGDPISRETMARLFQPFVRGDVKAGRKGLGLGLYIAAEIIKAHHGSLDVVSNEEETRFTARIPA